MFLSFDVYVRGKPHCSHGKPKHSAARDADRRTPGPARARARNEAAPSGERPHAAPPQTATLLTAETAEALSSVNYALR